MNKPNATYVDLEGTVFGLSQFDAAERKLLAEIKKLATAIERSKGDRLQRWCDFDNAWLPRIVAFYEARKISHKHVTKTALFQIAQDLSSRMAVAFGLARKADYRDRLREIIATSF